MFGFENLSGETTLEIFNAAGKQVYRANWQAQSQETKRVSFENQVSGVYFWKISSGNGVVSGKVVKR
jgi:hypothetical protein